MNNEEGRKLNKNKKRHNNKGALVHSEASKEGYKFPSPGTHTLSQQARKGDLWAVRSQRPQDWEAAAGVEVLGWFRDLCVGGVGSPCVKIFGWFVQHWISL